MATVSDFVVQRVSEWGVGRIFAFPGDGIGECPGALENAQRDEADLKYARPPHEKICSLMATAHAKFTGEVGVCAVTSSPGSFHMVNDLYDAQMETSRVPRTWASRG
ncbi:thiamine pyrophosphate-binding protein [Arthrobacter sp. LAPM80]|uniref:thiamine pyrophosphate-binding protein n=1 Tax=Arthrobacter sp. LAPM80 TaxID=3141788 RepID=UPI00398A8D9E